MPTCRSTPACRRLRLQRQSRLPIRLPVRRAQRSIGGRCGGLRWLTSPGRAASWRERRSPSGGASVHRLRNTASPPLRSSTARPPRCRRGRRGHQTRAQQRPRRRCRHQPGMRSRRCRGPAAASGSCLGAGQCSLASARPAPTARSRLRLPTRLQPQRLACSMSLTASSWWRQRSRPPGPGPAAAAAARCSRLRMPGPACWLPRRVGRLRCLRS